ncbi:PREDICTED: solute carrier family 35 member B1 [Trachymyrmex cornetzi]|uniref:Solute carrier family 35 member B1 like protein n=1 Tax=Trachymyrmex cornetzi TaxID=471704 RepID=A0A195DDP8_9HYME|nr:PREDICTED: solute carrier family 35 member B1 [Trachymyrmex cornetzi]KYN10554.1 Solute carrier family 35 member B1 like protein [Trachymyrmex cornetzi]
MATTSEYTKLFVCATGIFVCYFYFGMLQEKITRGQYGDGENREKFTYMFALVFVQCLVNYIFAKMILLTVMKQGEDTTRTVYYSLSALTYLLAMVCSNMALQFVNYPTQVIGKAGKPIPVMVLGVLLGKKIYPIRKYIFIFLIVVGVALFMYKDGNVSKKQAESQLSVGELLLLLSLMMDGLTSAVQERMRAEHNSKSGHMMLNMNFWSVIFSSTVILISGELLEFIRFLQRYPSTIWHITTFSMAGAFGQYFIFLTVAEFGPLPCSIITTTRKFFTVLGSILIFGNNLSLRQWLSTLIVFLGLFLDAMYGKDKSKKGTVK